MPFVSCLLSQLRNRLTLCRITVVRSVGPDGAIWSNPDVDLAVSLVMHAVLIGRDLLVVYVGF